MSESVYQFVIHSLRRLHYDADEVTGATSLGPDGLDLESLALAELLLEIDMRFGYTVEEDDTERVALLTIDELVDEVSARLAVAQP